MTLPEYSILHKLRVGLNVELPLAGRLDVTGHSGFAFRWGAGWFEAIRDGGVAWSFERSAEQDVQKRVDILIQLLRGVRNRRSLLPLQDLVLAIAGGEEFVYGSLDVVKTRFDKR